MRVAWRRSTLPSPPSDDRGDPELIDQLRGEIGRHGPITFARFMEVALYDPKRGYYASSTERPTRAGDFLTAPELHPIFGWVLARHLESQWRRMGEPDPFTLREYGAGTGTLMLSVVEGLRRAGSGLADVLRYQPVDLPAQVGKIRERLGASGNEALLDESSTGAFVGAVIANEYLDALPVHRVAMSDDGLRELRVGWHEDRFVEVEVELSDARLGSWFDDANVQLVAGQVAEVNLAMLDWLHEVGRDLMSGAVIVIDYGATAAEQYGVERRTGTLRAFRGQHVSSDVLSAVGRQDLTANVDLDALERGARTAGLMPVKRSRQAEFLIANGLDEAYAAARAEADQDWDAALLLRSAVHRLLDTAALGGYAVVTLAKDT